MEHEQKTSVDTPSTKRTLRVPLKPILGILTVAIVLVGGYLSYQKFAPKYPLMLPEALRESLIGNVATVNGESISRTRYNAALAAVADMATQNGIELTDATVLTEIKKTALKTVIENEVLLQAARAANTEVDDVKIEEQILATNLQYGGEEAFLGELKKVGISYKEYRKSVIEQTLLTNYMDKAVPAEGEISDEEVKAFYIERTKDAGEGVEIPKFEDVKDQVRTFLTNNKRQEKIRAHIDTLIAAAEVKELITITEPVVEESTETATSSTEAPTE